MKSVFLTNFGSAQAGPTKWFLNNVRYKGYVVDALAPAGDEGRGKLR